MLFIPKVLTCLEHVQLVLNDFLESGLGLELSDFDTVPDSGGVVPPAPRAPGSRFLLLLTEGGEFCCVGSLCCRRCRE